MVWITIQKNPKNRLDFFANVIYNDNMNNAITQREKHFILEMGNKAKQIPLMKGREINQELAFIRKEYEIGHISMEVANRAGKPFVNGSNAFARKIAEKHNVTRPPMIKHNVKFYPTVVY